MNEKELLPILKEHFGEGEANLLWEKATALFARLLPMTEGESKGRKKNMIENILPFAAIYKVLLEDNIPREKALEDMYAIMEKRTRAGMRKTYETMGKLPFFFPLFRKMFSTGLKGDSWQVEWVANDAERFEYNIKKCLWKDVCDQLGCPELCGIFCRNDEINFIDASPRLHFCRKTTLGAGGNCCDFHFFRHDPPKDWDK